MRAIKWCVYCGRPGHSSHQCDWPRDVPPPPTPPKEPDPDPPDSDFDDDPNYMYGTF